MMLAGKRPVKEALQKLHGLGPGTVIITDGKHGVHMLGRQHYYFLKPRRVKVVEATGAGDAFGAGFLAGYIRKKDAEFALKLGLANAESVLQHFGAKNELLRWSQAMKETRAVPQVAKERL
jgi:sugar/nucleoside kinase (ribokinase family)